VTDWSEKSFDLVLETTKLLVTLSIGALTITITFHNQIVSHESTTAHVLLATAWLLYALSVATAPWILNAMVTLTAGAAERFGGQPPSVWAVQLRTAAFAQFSLFFLALLATIAYGVVAL
jgi:hypothetical protein